MEIFLERYRILLKDQERKRTEEKQEFE